MHKVRLAAFFSFMLSAMVCSPGAMAQQSEDSGSASGVQILKLYWQKQIRLPSNYDPAIIPTRGVFVDPASKQSSSPRQGSATDARSSSSNTNASFDADGFFPATPRHLPVYYVYRLRVKNISGKKIEGVAWTYAFLDRETKAELGRHEFLSYRKISEGSAGLLENPLRTPPVRVVKTSDDQPSQRAVSERATIECVLYADETTWRSARTSEDVCNALIKGNPAKRKPAPVPRQN